MSERTGEDAVEEIREEGDEPSPEEREFLEGEGVDLAESPAEVPRWPTGEPKTEP